MQRKQFLAAGISGAAAVAAGIAASADSTSTSSTSTSNSASNCGPHPMPLGPGGSPRPHTPHARASTVDEALRRVQRIVEALTRDPNDYGGHKGSALGFLGQAQGELSEAVAFEQAHASATPPPI